jgi:hypothetical protein
MFQFSSLLFFYSPAGIYIYTCVCVSNIAEAALSNGCPFRPLLAWFEGSNPAERRMFVIGFVCVSLYVVLTPHPEESYRL